MSPDARIRRAVREDLPAIVALLADDELGRGREGGVPDRVYSEAFERISRDPANAVYVIDQSGEVLGCGQLTVIPGLSRRAATRGLIEAVRVAARHRGRGLGRWFMEELIAIARREGCSLVQLTSDKRRRDAHRFYESLGFTASHEGFKLALE
jgi:GNAT superfamily N-acetyltransferase